MLPDCNTCDGLGFFGPDESAICDYCAGIACDFVDGYRHGIHRHTGHISDTCERTAAVIVRRGTEGEMPPLHLDLLPGDFTGMPLTTDTHFARFIQEAFAADDDEDDDEDMPK